MHRLTDLADVIRAAGLSVVEVQGWQTRGRATDGGMYRDGQPVAVMIHHTASNASPQNDVAYMAFNAQHAPIGNLYLARDGSVWVMAAGPANTNGTGGPLGPVPADDMNRRSIAIEAANTGVGEPWPVVQQDAYVTLVAALCKAYGIPAAQVYAHHEWAPGRKIDPFGPSRWGPGQWVMDRFRADVASAMTEAPTPLPGGNDVIHPIAPYRNTDTRRSGAWLAPNEDHVLTLDRNKIPANAVAVALNVAAISASGQPGWCALWPAGQPFQGTSTVNFESTGAHASSTIIGVKDGKFQVRTSQRAHLIVDVTGYWD